MIPLMLRLAVGGLMQAARSFTEPQPLFQKPSSESTHEALAFG